MEQMTSLRKYLLPEFVYGATAGDLAGRSAANLALHKVLVVSDPGVAAAGWTGRVVDSLHRAGVATEPFYAVTPNPKDREVMAGADRYRAAGCNGIVAVGGGSPMDCAKGIGIVSSSGGSILEYEGVDQIPQPMPPLICIPTTAGTAADISQFAIITNTADNRKIAIISKAVVPDLALIDPLTTTTMDAPLTAATGLDALVHAMEAYVSTAGSPFTDLRALHAVSLIVNNLQRAVAEPDNLAARDALMLASTEAGMAFSNASLGAVHAMAHSLGGLLDSPHGVCNALLLEHLIRFNFPAAPDRYRRIADAFGMATASHANGELGDLLADRIRQFRTALGITGSLSQEGVTTAHIPALARNAMQDACMVTNPRRPTLQEIEAIYAAAL